MSGPSTGPMRNYDAWKRSIKDFSWLKDAAPGAMDIDFMVERGGQFLILESKPWNNGVEVPYGQNLALYRLSCVEQFRVYLVGEGQSHLHVMQYGMNREPIVRRKGALFAYYPPEEFIPTTKDGLSSLVKGWWQDHEHLMSDRRKRG